MFASVYQVFDKESEMIGGDRKEREVARDLVRKMVNSMSAKMEIGSPMASMYLLGNPDHYPSHKYVTFFWRSYVQFVRAHWTDELNPVEDEPEDNDERVPLGRQDGKIVATSAVDDYRYRPSAYENVSLYEWIQCAERRIRTKKERAEFEEEVRLTRYLKADYHRRASRLPVQHVFLPGHDLFSSHSVSCDFSRLSNVIPNFIGGAVPRADKGDRAYYCISM
ncbi:hypothetical protein B0H13DRAFT_1546510, partial [Mycena leptocephala]